ncbi:MAG: acyl carrier protein [Oscillospiraceae bacterium]|nr:acyl carrier protein [Oscillospiraceae bacterium]
MEQLLQILIELHPDIDFEKHTSLIDDAVLDSFDIITIVGEINDAFDVAIPAAQIVPDNFNSAASLYKLIESLEE